jgi:hypothetical protein
MRCGKPRCRCKNDPPDLHGPYIQWTRTVNGKTVTKLLTPEQLSRYQPWLDNAAQLRAYVTELEALTIQAVKNAEGWGELKANPNSLNFNSLYSTCSTSRSASTQIDPPCGGAKTGSRHAESQSYV